MKTPRLSEREVQAGLDRLNGWSLNPQGEITKTYVLQDFSKSLQFVNMVGYLAEKANHHPDITVRWNKVQLSLSTHDSGGLTQKDLDLAQETEKLYGAK